jgi:predicted DNA-binding protein with PD1-like motif
MKSQLIALPADTGAPRTFAVVLSTGEEVTEALNAFATEHELSAAQVTALGAFSSVELGYFDWQRKEYARIPIDEQVEVLSLVGDIALKDGAPFLHPHVTVGKRDGSAWGGHLLRGVVRPTLEVIVTESPSVLARRYDPQTGLALIVPEERRDEC